MENEKIELQKELKIIYKTKFEYYNILMENIEKYEDIKYKLIIDEKIQHELLPNNLIVLFSRILRNFWESPQLAAKLLLIANYEDVKNYLAHLVVNNFYENILSPNDKEYHLLYVITVLLKDEINKLNKDFCNHCEFLSNSRCSIIFDEFLVKGRLQLFCKKIFLSIIEIFESKFSSKEFNFNINDLNNMQKNNNITKNNIKKVLKFVNIDKYMIDLSKEELNKKMSEFEHKKNKEMKDYIYNLSKRFEEGENYIYSNTKFINNLNEDSLIIYWDNFSNITNLINIFLENINRNLVKLPFQIKCLCKIIKILINKKYKYACTVEKNAFISKFLFCKLIFPYFINTPVFALINEFIISDSTKNNLLTIKYILSKFLFSEFFRADNKKEKNFTPFNVYFIEKMPKIIELYKKITDVKLPLFINKILENDEDQINNKINFVKEVDEIENNFDFFEKEINEVSFSRNICFSLEEVYILVKNLDKFKENLLQSEKNDKMKTIKYGVESVLNEYNQNLIKNLLDSKKIKIQPIKRDYIKHNSSTELSSRRLEHLDDNKKINLDENNKRRSKNERKNTKKKEKVYFLISDLLIKKEYEKSLSNYKSEKQCYHIKEIKNNKNDRLIEKQNNIIKIKNLFCIILYYFNEIDSIDFNENTTANILNILRELKKYMNTDFVICGFVPSEWYINELIRYIKKLPKETRNTKIEKIINELMIEVNNSIYEIQFGPISQFQYSSNINNMKYYKQYYLRAKEISTDLNLNIKIQKIIYEENIPITIIYKNDHLVLKTFEKTKKQSILGALFPHQTIKKPFTIENFINEFPDLTKNTDDIFKKLKSLHVFSLFNDYFESVRHHIKNMKITKDEKEIDNINNKIYDYVLEQLHSKIFPKDPTNKDEIIYENSKKLQWIELNDLNENKQNLNFEQFLPYAIKYFDQLDKEKSPRKKVLYMQKIFDCIFGLGILNEKAIEGVDFILPILNFSLIKAKQKRINSNCKFMELFLENKEFGYESSHLAELMVSAKKIETISFKDFKNITESDFLQNCELSVKNELY